MCVCMLHYTSVANNVHRLSVCACACIKNSGVYMPHFIIIERSTALKNDFQGEICDWTFCSKLVFGESADL